jgi:hypothetical protein
MKMTMTEDSFLNYWPESRKDQFSLNALRAMFQWYDELDQDLEFDPIAFCCEWSEYPNFSDAYWDLESRDDDEMGEEGCRAFFEDRATVIKFDGGVLIGQY